jgi:hypothetical protein
MSFSKVSSSSSSLESSSSSLETYSGGEDLEFTFLLLYFSMRQVCFPLLRFGESDLLEEELLIATVATSSLSESRLSSSESHSLPICASPYAFFL